ncbi:Uncharacterized protein ybdG [Salmonella enterica subsp. enterica]|uniref:Uncharacterized protein ybdG n=1 Tax=Salmonella enterica I TaxID=59201 RepID=A0A379ULJ6_SALET|nr:Uncharacterized protein ybdG [Salmonella enterica subsp. enterica]
MTNIGTFRAYLNEYLRHHPRIRKDMTLMVRQLAPDDHGLPIEIYAFTNTVVWLEYESIQADIFDHIFAVVEEFWLAYSSDADRQRYSRAVRDIAALMDCPIA